MKLLRKTEVLERTGLRHSMLYQLIADGAFPRPVSLSPRRVGWVEAEIVDWIAERIAERDGRKKAKINRSKAELRS